MRFVCIAKETRGGLNCCVVFWGWVYGLFFNQVHPRNLIYSRYQNRWCFKSVSPFNCDYFLTQPMANLYTFEDLLFSRKDKVSIFISWSFGWVSFAYLFVTFQGSHGIEDWIPIFQATKNDGEKYLQVTDFYILPKINMEPESDGFPKGISSSRGPFSGSM